MFKIDELFTCYIKKVKIINIDQIICLVIKMGDVATDINCQTKSSSTNIEIHEIIEIMAMKWMNNIKSV